MTPLDEEKRATGTEKRGASAPRSTACRPRTPPPPTVRPMGARRKKKTRFFGAARATFSLRQDAARRRSRTAADRVRGGAGRAWMLKTAKRTSVMRYQAWRRYQRGDRKRCGRRGGARAYVRAWGASTEEPSSFAARSASRHDLLRRLLPGPGRVRVPHATSAVVPIPTQKLGQRTALRDRRAQVDSAARSRTRRRRRASPEPGRCRRRAARRKLFLSTVSRRRKARRKARRRTAFVWHETRKPRNSVRFERTHEPDFGFSRNLVAKTKKRFRKLGAAVRGVGGGTRRGARTGAARDAAPSRRCRLPAEAEARSRSRSRSRSRRTRNRDRNHARDERKVCLRYVRGRFNRRRVRRSRGPVETSRRRNPEFLPVSPRGVFHRLRRRGRPSGGARGRPSLPSLPSLRNPTNTAVVESRRWWRTAPRARSSGSSPRRRRARVGRDVPAWATRRDTGRPRGRPRPGTGWPKRFVGRPRAGGGASPRLRDGRRAVGGRGWRGRPRGRPRGRDPPSRGRRRRRGGHGDVFGASARGENAAEKTTASRSAKTPSNANMSDMSHETMPVAIDACSACAAARLRHEAFASELTEALNAARRAAVPPPGPRTGPSPSRDSRRLRPGSPTPTPRYTSRAGRRRGRTPHAG